MVREREIGTLKNFFSGHGYGFVTLKNGSEAFIHARALPSPEDVAQLIPGVQLAFEVVTTARGLRAINAEIVKGV